MISLTVRFDHHQDATAFCEWCEETAVQSSQYKIEQTLGHFVDVACDDAALNVVLDVWIDFVVRVGSDCPTRLHVDRC